ncbi:hypothetical protein QOU10_31980, partial [Pseudomonas aeruginosa]
GLQPLRQQAHPTGWLPLKLLFQQNRPEATLGYLRTQGPFSSRGKKVGVGYQKIPQAAVAE